MQQPALKCPIDALEGSWPNGRKSSSGKRPSARRWLQTGFEDVKARAEFSNVTHFLEADFWGMSLHDGLGGEWPWGLTSGDSEPKTKEASPTVLLIHSGYFASCSENLLR